MKLSEIRSAIRNTKGNPTVVVELVAGKPMTLTLQKTAFDKELARIFDNARTAETGMSFDEDAGMIVIEGSTAAQLVDTAAQTDVESGGLDLDDADDLDDLL